MCPFAMADSQMCGFVQFNNWISLICCIFERGQIIFAWSTGSNKQEIPSEMASREI